jgi:ferredoxin
MTRLGIRNKIKELMGFGSSAKPPSAPARPRYPVTFVLPSGESYVAEAKEGDSLVLTSGRGAYPISTGCSDGTCGTCRVEILEGEDSLTSAGEHEQQTKSDNDIPDELRLGCQAAIMSAGVSVKIINVLGEELVEDN